MVQLSWAVSYGTETLTDDLLPSNSAEVELYYNEEIPEHQIHSYFPSTIQPQIGPNPGPSGSA